MKKLLKAFTLAEVLITLGIIGVVARITLPTLTTNVQMQTTATSLAKAINTLESVNEKIKMEGNTKSISRGIGNNSDNFNENMYLQALPNFLNGAFRPQVVIINGVRRSNLATFTTKDGIVFMAGLHGYHGYGQRFPRKYSTSAGTIIIDINGTKGPNRTGKDQFEVIVDNYGAVIPYGGAQYAEWFRNNGILPNPLWMTQCPSNKSSKPTDPRACVGSIVDNGMQILYGYNLIN